MAHVVSIYGCGRGGKEGGERGRVSLWKLARNVLGVYGEMALEVWEKLSLIHI